MTEIMTKRRYYIRGITIATLAGIGGITLLGAGGRSNAGLIGMLAYNKNTDASRGTIGSRSSNDCISRRNSR